MIWIRENNKGAWWVDLPAVSAISLTRSASLTLVPMGRLQLRKNSRSPPYLKKVAPSMSASLNVSSLSPWSAFGRSRWNHSSSSTESNSFISSNVSLGLCSGRRSMAAYRTTRAVGQTESRIENDAQVRKQPSKLGATAR